MGHPGRPRLWKLPVTITLDQDLIEWVRETSHKRKVSKSQIIREFILEAMEKESQAKIQET